MKKLTIILALLTTLCNAQNGDYINVINVTDTLSTNDTLTIVFTKTVNNGGSGMTKLQLWTSTYLQDCLNIYSSFLVLDSANTYKHKVKITSAMGVGNARIYSNATVGGYKPFYIKQNDVSVKELDKSQIVSIQYFDIYGKENPSNNEGLTIMVTTYSNGYQYKDKIILVP